MKKTIKPKCKYCYDKGYSSVMTGGGIAVGDFPGDKSYAIPQKIENIPCPRCSPKQKIEKLLALTKKEGMKNPERNQQMLQVLDVLTDTIEKVYGSNKYVITISVQLPKPEKETVYMYEMSKNTKPSDFSSMMCQTISHILHDCDGCPNENGA